MNDRDLDFEADALRDAFERMAPSPEAEARMLANLREAAATTSSTRHEANRYVARIALPVVACLVLLTGVGALVLGNGVNEQYLQMGATSAQVPESAAPEAFSARAGTAEDDTDIRYPLVRLSNGEFIRITLDEDGPLAANPAVIRNELESAQAFNETEDQTAPCTIFSTTDATYPYAVRFDDGNTYLAAPVAE